MCGIAGIYSSEPVEEKWVWRMLEAIGYRGPDHTEVKCYQSPSGSCLAVGQVRLAVLDPRPEANQPFESQGGETSLTFNGEFYNFQRLKRRLEKEGVFFRTRSDTEVALHLLDQHDDKALSELWGMFAGAYFRRRQGHLLLFRDRLGKKPLYVYLQQKRLFFASEPKAILAVLDRVPPPNDKAISRFFYLGYIPSELCAYQGMFKLPAGSFLRIGPDFIHNIERWYFSENEPSPRETELEETFMDAVSLRMISDVPLAAFLSGGLDSSLVVAAMSRLSSKPINSFSVRFQGPQALDESGYARMVARHCGTEHHEIVLDVAGLKETLPQVLDHFDEPFGDASAIPTFLVSQAARKYFTVALTGDGADEVFAGYRKYLADYYLSMLGPFPLRNLVWRPLVSMLPTGRTNRFLELNRRMRRLLMGDAGKRAARHINLLHMSPIRGDRLFGPRLKRLTFNAIREELSGRLPSRPGLNELLLFDQFLVLQDDMFVKIDRMGMMASLELRSPFVDHRLVLLANGLPAERKLKGTRRKKILVEKLGHLLPPQILSRPKTGFEMPLGVWMRQDLRTWTEDRLFHYADTAPWVDQPRLRQVWQTHCSGKLDCTELLWYHIVFATWLKGFYG